MPSHKAQKMKEIAFQFIMIGIILDITCRTIFWFKKAYLSKKWQPLNRLDKRPTAKCCECYGEDPH